MAPWTIITVILAAPQGPHRSLYNSPGNAHLPGAAASAPTTSCPDHQMSWMKDKEPFFSWKEMVIRRNGFLCDFLHFPSSSACEYPNARLNKTEVLEWQLLYLELNITQSLKITPEPGTGGWQRGGWENSPKRSLLGTLPCLPSPLHCPGSCKSPFPGAGGRKFAKVFNTSM